LKSEEPVTQIIERSLIAKGIHQDFLTDVLSGLASVPKRLSCRFLYDERGSRLFDEICELPEYYLTRTEIAIMAEFANDMAQEIGPGVRLVEFGSGSSVKSRILLDSLRNPAAYIPVDISCEHLTQTVKGLKAEYPRLEILPVCADFCRDFRLPQGQHDPARTVIYFPGSTIGNFAPNEGSQLLRQIVKLSGQGGGLLIGIDLKKDVHVIERAYNDSLGVTAEFNLNLLTRMQRELDAELDEDAFEHLAFYNPDAGRVEIYIQSLEEQTIGVLGEVFALGAGELIHTEDSHKYTVDEFAAIGQQAGLELVKSWTDRNNYFAVLYFRVAGLELGNS
jgi:dimethylhistidine N-methyltransferase